MWIGILTLTKRTRATGLKVRVRVNTFIIREAGDRPLNLLTIIQAVTLTFNADPNSNINPNPNLNSNPRYLGAFSCEEEKVVEAGPYICS